MATKNEKLAIKFDELPNGIVMEVLARLPAKSIMRFKLVSKNWFHLFTCNLHFRELYKTRAGVREGGVTHVILPKTHYRANEWDRRFFVIDTKKPPKTRVSVYEPPLPYDVNAITNIVDGLVCVYDKYEKGRFIYVHNISTREILDLSPLEEKYYYRTCFIGFDPRNMEYKVVRIFSELYEKVAKCDVFTLDTNNKEMMHDYRFEWRSIDISYINGDYFDRTYTWEWLDQTGFCVSSVVTSNVQYKYDGSAQEIVLFDVEKEKFEIIKVPREITGSVALIQGHLSLVDIFRGSYNEMNGCSMQIFWRKIFDVKRKDNLLFTGMVIKCPFPNKLNHTHDGIITCNHVGHVFSERYIRKDNNQGVIDCYDINTGKYKELQVNNKQSFLNTRAFHPFLVVENIISLKSIKD